MDLDLEVEKAFKKGKDSSGVDPESIEYPSASSPKVHSRPKRTPKPISRVQIAWQLNEPIQDPFDIMSLPATAE